MGYTFCLLCIEIDRIPLKFKTIPDSFDCEPSYRSTQSGLLQFVFLCGLAFFHKVLTAHSAAHWPVAEEAVLPARMLSARCYQRFNW